MLEVRRFLCCSGLFCRCMNWPCSRQYMCKVATLRFVILLWVFSFSVKLNQCRVLRVWKHVSLVLIWSWANGGTLCLGFLFLGHDLWPACLLLTPNHSVENIMFPFTSMVSALKAGPTASTYWRLLSVVSHSRCWVGVTTFYTNQHLFTVKLRYNVPPCIIRTCSVEFCCNVKFYRCVYSTNANFQLIRLSCILFP